jgi:hypothetical protein
MSTPTVESHATLTPPLAAAIARARRAGWGEALLALLDVLEPLGALGAGLLTMAQPAARLLGDAGSLGALAHLLETPEGVALLRRSLNGDEDADGTAHQPD